MREHDLFREILYLHLESFPFSKKSRLGQNGGISLAFLQCCGVLKQS